jgi:hypothetical protein
MVEGNFLDHAKSPEYFNDDFKREVIERISKISDPLDLAAKRDNLGYFLGDMSVDTKERDRDYKAKYKDDERRLWELAALRFQEVLVENNFLEKMLSLSRGERKKVREQYEQAVEKVEERDNAVGKKIAWCLDRIDEIDDGRIDESWYPSVRRPGENDIITEAESSGKIKDKNGFIVAIMRALNRERAQVPGPLTVSNMLKDGKLDEVGSPIYDVVDQMGQRVPKSSFYSHYSDFGISPNESAISKFPEFEGLKKWYEYKSSDYDRFEHDDNLRIAQHITGSFDEGAYDTGRLPESYLPESAFRIENADDEKKEKIAIERREKLFKKFGWRYESSENNQRSEKFFLWPLNPLTNDKFYYESRGGATSVLHTVINAEEKYRIFCLVKGIQYHPQKHYSEKDIQDEQKRKTEKAALLNYEKRIDEAYAYFLPLFSTGKITKENVDWAKQLIRSSVPAGTSDKEAAKMIEELLKANRRRSKGDKLALILFIVSFDHNLGEQAAQYY